MTQLAQTNEQQQQPTNGNGDRRIAVQDSGDFANLLDTAKFEHLWRVAQLFASSRLIPEIFRGKTEDCFIAIQMAMRLGVEPFMFLQNTYPAPGGKPGMEGKFAIALVNSSGLFAEPLDYEFSGTGDEYGCVAWTVNKRTGTKIIGPRVTIGIAKSEGWYARNPKWKSVPDLMLTYRAGAWFGRTKCPERLMGMQTIEELDDIDQAPRVVVSTVVGQETKADRIARRLGEQQQSNSQPPAGATEGMAPPSAPPVSKPQQPAEKMPVPDVDGVDAVPPEDEDDAVMLAALGVEAFKDALRAHAKQHGVTTKQEFEGGIFRYCTRIGVGDVAKLSAPQRLDLYAAVSSNTLNYKDGSVREFVSAG